MIKKREELKYHRARGEHPQILEYASFHTYHQRFQQERRDILKFLPATSMNKFPVQGNEGLYGWTIRGTNQVNLRDDLQGLKKLETDIHECAHTPDEYETRRKTEWRLEWLFPLQEKYQTLPPEYTA